MTSLPILTKIYRCDKSCHTDFDRKSESKQEAEHRVSVGTVERKQLTQNVSTETFQQGNPVEEQSEGKVSHNGKDELKPIINSSSQNGNEHDQFP